MIERIIIEGQSFTEKKMAPKYMLQLEMQGIFLLDIMQHLKDYFGSKLDLDLMVWKNQVCSKKSFCVWRR